MNGTPADILITAVDGEGRLRRVSSDRHHNLFGLRSAPYMHDFTTSFPSDHFLIDILSACGAAFSRRR